MHRTLKRQYENHVRKQVASGVVLVAYACPGCKELIYTKAALEQELEAVVYCPHCEVLHNRITNGIHAKGLTIG